MLQRNSRSQSSSSASFTSSSVASVMIPNNSTSADDLENGSPSSSFSSHSSSFFSQEDASGMDVLISKFRVSHDDDSSITNKPPRRRSQCPQLVSRRPRSASSSPSPTPIVSATTTNKSSLVCQQWETAMMILNNADSNFSPNKVKCLPSHQSLLATSLSQVRRLLTVAAIALIIALFGILRQQQVQISSLRSQLEIINQHRMFLETKQSDVVFHLRTSETSLQQCKHSLKQMSNAHEAVGNSMIALRQEHSQTKLQLELCQGEGKYNTETTMKLPQPVMGSL